MSYNGSNEILEFNAGKKVALITGITGQDGSYLAEFLVEKGYAVHGLVRRSSTFNTSRIDHIFGKIKCHYGDMLDSSNLNCVFSRIQPHEVYNLAAQSHVKVSFEMPEYTGDCDALGVTRILEAIRSTGLEKTCRFYQASTSEMFGQVKEIPQTEKTPFCPQSPYGCAKVYGFWLVRNYRESYNMFAVSGILFNHESPRRGPTFVTRKITMAVSRIAAGTQSRLDLGNIFSLRDWGHAKDYVRAMWMMLQQEVPQDLVIATSEQHSVKEFCELCFSLIGIDIVWKNLDIPDKVEGWDMKNNRQVIGINEVYFRPSEVETLLGDASKAEKCLGWEPSCTFHDLVYDMMEHDCKEIGYHALPQKEECMKRMQMINKKMVETTTKNQMMELETN